MKSTYLKIIVLLLFTAIVSSCLKTAKKEGELMSAYEFDQDGDGKDEVLISFFSPTGKEIKSPLVFSKSKGDRLTLTDKSPPAFKHLRNVYLRKRDGRKEYIFLDHGTDEKHQITGGHVWSYDVTNQKWSIISQKKKFYFNGDFFKHKDHYFEVRVGLDFIEVFIDGNLINTEEVLSPNLGFLSAKFFTYKDKVSLILGPRDRQDRKENNLLILTFNPPQNDDNGQWKVSSKKIAIPLLEYGVVNIIAEKWDDDDELDFSLVLHNVGFSSPLLAKLSSKKNYQFEKILISNHKWKNNWLSDLQVISKPNGDKTHYFRVHPGGSPTGPKACGIGKLTKDQVQFSKQCILGFVSNLNGSSLKVVTIRKELMDIRELTFGQSLFLIKK